MKKSIYLCLLLASAANSHAAQTCLSYIPDATPTTRYTVDVANGTVTDSDTGLMWQQCSIGQTASAGDCTGSATELNWQGALQAGEASTVGGYSDWRLPNRKELNSIVAVNCYNSSINLSVFPGTPSDVYWSSSPFEYFSSDAWSVSFRSGIGSWGSRSGDNYVRLVR